MILMIDNFDSFTYNLVQYLGEMGCDLQVRRNDEITTEQIREMNPKRSSSRPAPARPPRPEFRSRRFASSVAKCRFWAFVWAIRRLARLWAATLCAPKA